MCVQVISRATALRASAEAAKKEADERTDVYKAAVDAMQQKLIRATEEMQRGNEVCDDGERCYMWVIHR
jgi:hypothetical protein